MARFGVNTFGRVGARMARLELGVAAINGARALKPRAPARTVPVPIPEGDADRKDHFVTINGQTFAGSHLIIDFWEAEGLSDKNRIEQAMIDAVEAAGATLLHIHLHTFTPSGGISGVAVLAESHISVHTWPERGYAAFDISCVEAPIRTRRLRCWSRLLHQSVLCVLRTCVADPKPCCHASGSTQNVDGAPLAARRFLSSHSPERISLQAETISCLFLSGC